MNELLEAFSDIITTIIGGLVAAVTLMITFRRDREKSDAEEQAQVKAFLEALRAEIEVVWDFYMGAQGLGREIETLKEGELLPEAIMARKYLHIYEGNAVLVGKVKERELRRQVVTTFTRVNLMIDVIVRYNELRRALSNGPAVIAGKIVERLSVHLSQMSARQRSKDALSDLQAHHIAVKQEVEKLIALFNRYGIK